MPMMVGSRGALLGGVSLGVLLALGSNSAWAQSAPFLYVTNQFGNSVSVISTSTNTVTSTVTGLSEPWGAAVRSDESLAYAVSLNGGGSPGFVSVINTATNTIIGTSIPVGVGPTAIALTPNGSMAYVTNETSNTVTAINTATDTVAATISVGRNPFLVAVSPDGTTAYVANNSYTSPNTGSVSVINTATNTVTATIPLGGTSDPAGLMVTPDGKTLYVTNTNNVTVISTTTNSITTTIPIAHSVGVAIAPNGATAYVLSPTSVSVINTATNTITNTISLGAGVTPVQIAISPDGTSLYVTENSNNAIAVINTATNAISTTIGVPAGSFPLYPAICSNGNALLAAGQTFKANTSGALGCTLASGPTGATGPIFTGGTMQFAGANISSSLPITLMIQGGTFDTAGNNATLSGNIGGSGGLTKIGTGTLTLSGLGNYSGPTTVSAGTLQAGIASAFSQSSAYTIANGATLDLNSLSQSIGSLAGAGTVTLGSATLTTGSDNTNTTFAGAIGGSGGLTKIGTGTLILAGTEGYTGSTTINGGTLEVDGSITASSAVLVNSGGTLSGTGIVDPSSVTRIQSGGTLSPGNAANPTGALAITGSLAFQSGALYLVQVTPTGAASVNVAGTASLAGTVNAVFASGSYIAKQYTILTASGGLEGTFNTLNAVNLPSNMTANLGYAGNSVFLDLIANLGVGGGLKGNQQSVAGGINNAFNTGGTLPLALLGLFNQSGPSLANALTQTSGETAAGSQQTTFNAMGQFMGVMTDPFMGRGGGINGSSAIGYAATPNPTDAFAMFTKAPSVAPTFGQRWSVWASGFGGSQSTSGNAVVGSNNTASNIAGTAVGADYLISPNTLAGFALAGGGTNFSVANGGTGRSDLFQLGAYVRHNQGPAYISAALAYGWQDITTNRNVTVAGLDQLRAEFNANAYSGRLEGGYRFVSPVTLGIGVTPYAAAQFVTFDLPAYMEQAISGTNNFALSYNAKDVTDLRSELGIRTDRSWAVTDGILTLRGRFAWAHDYDPDRSIEATFQTLPGSSFVVNGAAQAADSALTTASIEMKWKNGWSAAATFEGEFSSATSSYAGKGVVRYVW